MCKLFLISLLCYISINYSAALIPICKEDVFNYSEIEVNSIFKLKLIREFEIADLLIDTNIDYNDYLNLEGAKRMEYYRDLFNKQFLDIFDDRFINNPKKFATINTLNFINDLNKVIEVHRWCKDQYKDKFYNNTVSIMKNRSNFLGVLQSLHLNKFNQNDKFEQIKAIENMFLSFDLDKGITSALKHDTLTYIIKNHEILTLDNFTLNRFSRIFLDFRSTGKLWMNVFLPFNDANYKDSFNCITSKHLPRFYQKKT